MGGIRKPFLDLAGQPVLLRSLTPFLKHPQVSSVAVALGPDDMRLIPDWLLELAPRVRLVAGGDTRGDSVRAAVLALPPDVEIIAIHDAARPLVTEQIIDRCLEEVSPGRGVVAGWRAVDTIKEVDGQDRVTATVPRGRIWHAQTPQVFPRSLIIKAYESAAASGVTDTDDAALVERIGGEVVMVEGSAFNMKVTRPEDLLLAEFLLGLGTG